MLPDYEPFHGHGTDPAGHRAGASFVLVGRDSECARIDELLEGAIAGESGSLVVRGQLHHLTGVGVPHHPRPGGGDAPAPDGNRAR
jgi:hypothetical protein